MMANLEGVVHALRKKIAKQDEVIEELGSELGITASNLADAQNTIRSLKNPDMLINGAPMTLDRIQVMETGDLRIMPPPPAPDVCTQGSKNGKKDSKELVNANAAP